MIEIPKAHLCTNEDCQKDYDRTGCRAGLFCSIDCCKKDFEEREGTLAGFCGCKECLA